MNIKTPSSFTNKILIALCGAGIVASASLYTASAADYSDKNLADKKVIKIVDDGGETRRIKISQNGKTFVEENGERYVMEYDQQRPMTDEEVATFEREVEMVHRNIPPVPPVPAVPGVPPVPPIHPSADGHSYEVRIIRSHESEGSMFTEDGMSEQEKKEFAEEMRQVGIEIEQHHGEFARAEREVAIAMREIEQAHAADEISAEAMQQARAQLEATRESLSHEQESMRQSLESARAEIARLREEVNQSKRPE